LLASQVRTGGGTGGGSLHGFKVVMHAAIGGLVAAQQQTVNAAFVVGSSFENLDTGNILALGAMLQTQLTANASLNAALLSRGTTKKSSSTSSYSFSAKDANTLDSDAISHLAKAAFVAHAVTRQNMQAFEEPLFLQAAKVIDRIQLAVAENKGWTE